MRIRTDPNTRAFPFALLSVLSGRVYSVDLLAGWMELAARQGEWVIDENEEIE